MSGKLKFFCIGILAAGLLTGCPDKKKDDAKEEPKAEETQEADTGESEETAEEAAEADAGEEEAAVDQGMYIKAAYEITCVRTKVEDPEEQKAILAEVYPRYGFTAESFAKAEQAMKDKETVKIAVTERMKKCTPEIAAGFKEAGASAEEGDDGKKADGDTKKKKPSGPKHVTGTLKDTGVSGAGITGGQVQLNVLPDGKVTGRFRGKREGKGFMVPIKGEIGKTGTLRAKGSHSGNTVSITAKATDNAVAGEAKGAVHKKPYKVNFHAKK